MYVHFHPNMLLMLYTYKFQLESNIVKYIKYKVVYFPDIVLLHELDINY